MQAVRSETARAFPLISRAMRHRWLFLNFVARDIRSRYLGSISGAAWAILNPLALLGVYAFVFTTVFQVRFPELGKTGFVTFVAIVLWPWMMFQEGILRAIASIPANAGLMRKVAFPRELLVYAAIAAIFFIHLIGYALILLVLAASGEALQFKGVLLAGVTLLSLFLLATGCGLVLAALNAVVKDVEHIVSLVFMVLFYATPILYPLTLVPQSLRALFQWNPLTHIAGRLRDAWLLGAMPGVGDGVLFLVTLLFVLIAWALFHRIAPHFEDFI
jgi:lipopolysaccharide transport system permease protein